MELVSHLLAQAGDVITPKDWLGLALAILATIGTMFGYLNHRQLRGRAGGERRAPRRNAEGRRIGWWSVKRVPTLRDRVEELARSDEQHDEERRNDLLEHAAKPAEQAHGRG